MSKNLELVDTTMEKKIFSPKGLMQVDASRLRQDASGPGGSQVSAVPFPKSKAQSRSRREPAGSSSSSCSRSEPPSRKFTSKGNRKGKNVEDLEEIGEKKESAEFGSLQLPGSKKQNLNHLLNFHFTPREPHGRGGHFQHPPRTIRTKQVNDSCFIQANCQFMVSSDEDVEYHVDLLVHWKSVEQIIIRTYGDNPGCPICLAPPSAAKITKCGHIFCWSCILRYFSYGDERSRPCPICYKSICPEELKSVVANVLEEIHVGDIVNLQLMCRKKDSSSSSMPVSSKLGGEVENWKQRFQKLLRLTPRQVQTEVLEREHMELSHQLELTIESLETEFVVAATTELKKRMTLLLEKISRGNGSGDILELQAKQKEDMVAGESVEIKPATSVAGQREEETLDVSNELNVSGVGEERVNWDDYFCFYQAADGSNAFMRPLNMAMFWKSFGQDLSHWPQTIPLRVIEIDLVTVTVEWRKRHRFLQDVPLNSSIQLLEFELSGIVSQEVIGEFQDQLGKRKQRRLDRVRIEKRRERLQQEAERMTNFEPEKPKIGSLQDFPECGSPEEEAQALEYAIQASLAEPKPSGSGTASTTHIPIPSIKAMSSESASTSSIAQMSTSPSLSFAQALSAPSTWKRSPTFPVTVKSGSQASSSNVLRQRGTSESELDQDGSNVPAFRASVSDAIASAFANFELNEAETGSGPSNSGSKKKGRKKGKVLFATAMGMGSN